MGGRGPTAAAWPSSRDRPCSQYRLFRPCRRRATAASSRVMLARARGSRERRRRRTSRPAATARASLRRGPDWGAARPVPPLLDHLPPLVQQRLELVVNRGAQRDRRGDAGLLLLLGMDDVLSAVAVGVPVPQARDRHLASLLEQLPPLVHHQGHRRLHVVPVGGRRRLLPDSLAPPCHWRRLPGSAPSPPVAGRPGWRPCSRTPTVRVTFAGF